MSGKAIFFGSTTGNTRGVAEEIARELGVDRADVYDVAATTPSATADYDVLILGSPTYGRGQLQDDWVTFAPQLQGQDWSDKKVVLFGCGDQAHACGHFVGALGVLYDLAISNGATVVGGWSTWGYRVVDDNALRDGMFAGLAIDQDQQGGLSEARIHEWCRLVRRQLGE